jgi:ribonuclease G
LSERLIAELLLAGLFIATGPGEWRAALVEGEEAVELFVERGEGEAAGSLHLGRVRRLVPALAAVHVDIGGARPAFLPQSEIVPRGTRLDEGARVLVQVRREAQGGKAARVTTALRLRGRHVELVLGRPGLVAADKLPAEERERLNEALAHGESGIGFAIIEAGPIDALLAEMARVRERWHDLRDRAARLEPPRRLDPPQSLAAALAARLPLPPSHIAVDDPAALPEIRAAFPEAEAANSPEMSWPIDLDAAFERALAPSLALAAGWLHIEATQAAVLIDVDSGTPETGARTGSLGRTALAVNLAAAREIARQLRLRNLGGGIVVDFVGLEGTGARARVRAALAAALAADPAGPQILGWTRLGHLELVRPRRGRPLAESLLEPRSGGMAVKTPLTVAHEALRALAHEERARPGRRWRLLVASEVAAALAGPAADALSALERRLGRPIAVMPEPGRARERFEIVPT